MSNSRKAPVDASNWFVGSADINNTFHQMLISRWLQAFFALPAVLASGVCYTGETIDRRRLALDCLIYHVTTTLPLGFSWVMCFCQDVIDKCTLAGSADSHLFVGRDHSAPPLLGSKHGTGSVGFR